MRGSLFPLAVLLIAVAAFVALLTFEGDFFPVSPTPTIIPLPTQSDLKSFSSYSQVADFLSSAGSSAYGGYYRYAVAEGALLKTNAAPLATSTPDYSSTNVQVAGVDEADFFKSDGEHLYTITQGKLVIAKAYPASGAKIVAVLNDSTYAQLFVNGDKLVAFGSEQFNWEPIVRPLEKQFESQTSVSSSGSGQATSGKVAASSFAPIRCLGCYPYYSSSSQFVKIFDVSDRSSPKLLKKIDFRGNIVGARMIGSRVYAIFSEYASPALPFPLYRVDGSVKSVPATDISYFDYPFDNYQFTTVLGVDLNDLQKEESRKIVLMGGSQTLFVSAENAFVTYTRYNDYSPMWKAYEEILLAVMKEKAALQDNSSSQSFSLKESEAVEVGGIKLALLSAANGTATFAVNGRGIYLQFSLEGGKSFSEGAVSVSLSSIADGVATGSFTVEGSAKIAAASLEKLASINSSDASDWRKDNLRVRVAQEFLNSLEEKERSELYQNISVREEEIRQENLRQRESTAIYKFSLGEKIDYAGRGSVPGRVLNQFSMDEHNGYFRIATTLDQQWLGGVPVRPLDGEARPVQPTVIPSTNNVYVLDGSLGIVGRLEGLAPGESIHSARFMGNRVYLVTFRQVDPLFTIDLSEPTNPKVLGKLKIPGYSDYLHPFDENHLIGVGKDVIPVKNSQGEIDENAAVFPLGVKLSLFDVSDVSNPEELSSYSIGDAGTQSYALQDHKAFLFSKSKDGLLVLPVQLAEVDREKNPTYPTDHVYGSYTFQGAYVFNVGLEKGFELAGRVTHADEEALKKLGDYYYGGGTDVKRSAYIGGVLYTVSDKFIKANDLATLSQEASVALPYQEYAYGYGYGVAVAETTPPSAPVE